MSDDPIHEAWDEEAANDDGPPTETATDERGRADTDGGTTLTDGANDVETYLVYAGLVGFAVLAVAATVALYGSLDAVVSTFIEPRFQPLFRAGVNVLFLIAAAIGISVLLRRLR